MSSERLQEIKGLSKDAVPRHVAIIMDGNGRWAEQRDLSRSEGHRAGMEVGYCHIEKLTNLEGLPGHGFEISCFPFKIKDASAGFTRAVAIFEE